jgi:hypothetical protein
MLGRVAASKVLVLRNAEAALQPSDVWPGIAEACDRR